MSHTLMPFRRSLGFAVLLAALLASSLAHADRAAIVVTGQVDQGTINLVEVVIEQTLRKRGWSIKDGGSDAVDGAALVSCLTGQESDCVAELLAPLGVDKVVVARASSERAKDGEEDVAITAWIVTSKGGVVVVSDRRSCERCSADLLEATTSDLVGSLIREMRGEGSSSIRVQSTPPGAVILLDGERVGVTNTSVGVSPGTHKVSVDKSGYRAPERELTVSEGKEVSVDFVLEPSGGPAGGETAPRSEGGLTKWIVGGSGAVAVVAGLSLFAFEDGELRGTDRQRTRAETTVVGFTLTAAGAIALGVSGYLFYRESKRPRTTPSVSVAGDGVWVNLAGTF